MSETPEQTRIRARLAALLESEQRIWAGGSRETPIDNDAVSAIREERLVLRAEWDAELKRIVGANASR